MTELVQLSEDTVSVLKTLYEVNQSLIIDHEMIEDDETILRSKSENNTVMGKVKIAEQFPRNINIYDLREFISVLNIVDEPVLDLSNDNYMIVKSSDGKQKLRYIEANPDLINSYSSKDPNFACDDENIIVTEHQFKSVISAAQTLKFEYVGFVADGETLVLTGFNKNEGDEQENNSYSVELSDIDKEFKLLYKLNLQNINILLGEGDLLFDVDGERKISKVTTATGKTYWITFDSNSEY